MQSGARLDERAAEKPWSGVAGAWSGRSWSGNGTGSGSNTEIGWRVEWLFRRSRSAQGSHALVGTVRTSILQHNEEGMYTGVFLNCRVTSTNLVIFNRI